MNTRIENNQFEEERAFYNLEDAEVVKSIFVVQKSCEMGVDSVGEIITENPVMECNGKVVIRR